MAVKTGGLFPSRASAVPAANNAWANGRRVTGFAFFKILKSFKKTRTKST
jgi:hypothetical protein